MSNIALFGGAISNQNDTTNVEIYNSNFIENIVGDGSRVAIAIINLVTTTIDNCRFEMNSADFRGAINTSKGDGVDVIEDYIHIRDSLILSNTANQFK